MNNKKMNMIAYRCPSCGANVKIEENQSKVVCEYCGTEFQTNKEEKKQQAAPEVKVNSTVSNTSRKRKSIKIIGCVIIPLVGFWILGFGIIFINSINSIGSPGKNTKEVEILEINPFDNIKVEITGKEPYASISKVSSGDGSYTEFKYDKNQGLSNGDVIKITAEPKNGYVYTQSEYEYTVSGLDVLVTDIDQLSDESRELLYNEAKKVVEKSWTESLSYSDFTAEKLNIEIVPDKIYLNVNKEPSGYYSNDNMLMPSFETSFTCNGKSYTVYQYAVINNAYLDSNGNLHAEFQNIYSGGGFVWSDDYGINDSFGIDAYESELAMESSMEDDYYKLIK